MSRGLRKEGRTSCKQNRGLEPGGVGDLAVKKTTVSWLIRSESVLFKDCTRRGQNAGRLPHTKRVPRRRGQMACLLLGPTHPDDVCFEFQVSEKLFLAIE